MVVVQIYVFTLHSQSRHLNILVIIARGVNIQLQLYCLSEGNTSNTSKSTVAERKHSTQSAVVPGVVSSGKNISILLHLGDIIFGDFIS